MKSIQSHYIPREDIRFLEICITAKKYSGYLYTLKNKKLVSQLVHYKTDSHRTADQPDQYASNKYNEQ